MLDNSIKLSEFTLGKGDHDFDEIFDASLDTGAKKYSNNLNFLETIAENQTEDSTRFRNSLNKNRNYQINSLVNNYYEFIIHKMVQFDVRKYPDEIITKSIIVQGINIYRTGFFVTPNKSHLTVNSSQFGIKNPVLKFFIFHFFWYLDHGPYIKIMGKKIFSQFQA